MFDYKHTDDESLKIIADICAVDGRRMIFKKREGRKLAWLCEMDTAEFSWNAFVDEWGGGEYSVSYRDEKGRIQPSHEFTIAKTHRSKEEREAKEADELKRASGNSDLGKMIEVMERMAERAMRPQPDNSLATMLKAQSDSQALMMQMMMKQMETSATILAAALGNKTPAGPAADAAAMIRELKPLMSGNGAGSGFEQAVKQIKMLRDLTEGNPEPEEKGWGHELVGLAAEALSKFLPAGAQMPAQPTPALEPPARKALEAPDGATDAEKEAINTMNDIKAMCMAALPKLSAAALVNKDPHGVATRILNMCDEPEAAILGAALRHDKWVEVLFDNDERVRNRLTWFERLRQSVLDQLGLATVPPDGGNPVSNGEAGGHTAEPAGVPGSLDDEPNN